jgi:hypothetical protein
MQRGHHVDAVHLVLSVDIDFEEEAFGAEAGIVDEYLEVGRRLDVPNDGLHAGVRGKIGCKDGGTDLAVALQTGGDILEPVEPPGNERNIMSALSEFAGEGDAQSR